MAHTNHTANKNLPQFTDNDKPTWLGDVNEGFLKIDQGFSNVEALIAALQNRCAALEARCTVLESA